MPINKPSPMPCEALLDLDPAPGDEWCSKLFWAWKGKPEKAELRRQVQDMKATGISEQVHSPSDRRFAGPPL